MTLSKFPLLAMAFLALFAMPIQEAEATAKQQAFVDDATAAVRNFTQDPKMEWFRNNLHKAEAILIYPNVTKGGFILGGSGGSGVLIFREGNNWSNPAFYTMGSATFGFQAGIEVSEVILLVMTKRGRNALLTPEFKLGGDVSVTAGPVGAGAKGQTADILAFSRSKGLYGGLNLEGAVITTREKWNRKYYGRSVSTEDILIRRTVSNPGANQLRQAVRNVNR